MEREAAVHIIIAGQNVPGPPESHDPHSVLPQCQGSWLRSLQRAAHASSGDHTPSLRGTWWHLLGGKGQEPRPGREGPWRRARSPLLQGSRECSRTFRSLHLLKSGRLLYSLHSFPFLKKLLKSFESGNISGKFTFMEIHSSRILGKNENHHLGRTLSHLASCCFHHFLKYAIFTHTCIYIYIY